MEPETASFIDPVEALDPEGDLDALAPIEEPVLVGGLEPLDPDDAVEEATELVEALTMAWTTRTLYEDPRSIEAFDRALETLIRLAPLGLLVEVTPDGFQRAGQPVSIRREATQRLARELFAHGTAAVEIVEPPTSEELLRVVDVLAEPAGNGDPGELIVADGITSIALLRRELLAERLEPAEEESAEEADSGSFADELLSSLGHDPVALAEHFTNEYHRVYELVDPADHWGREEVVHAFIDVFFNLPRRHQGAILNLMVLTQERPESLLFVDQLGSTELSELARHLTSEAQAHLIEYARVAAEHSESQHHAELLRLIAETAGAGVTETVTRRIDDALRGESAGTRESRARLRRSHPSAEQHFGAGVNVMRGLLALAATSEPRPQLAAVWASKVTEAIRHQRLAEADAWLGAVAGTELPGDHKRALLDSLSAAVDGEVLDRILITFTAEDEGPGALVKRAAPMFIIKAVIDQLATERADKPRNRLAAALASVAKAHPEAVAKHLKDPRPRVVCAVLGALRRSEYDNVGKIRACLANSAASVRTAALRAVAELRPDQCSSSLLAALDDTATDVRAAAASLLAVTPDPRIDSALIQRFEQSQDFGERLVVIEALGRRTTTEAKKVLTRLASRFAITPKARVIRRTARMALGGHG